MSPWDGNTKFTSDKRLHPDTLIARSGQLRSLSEIKADVDKSLVWNPNASFSLHKHGFESALKPIMYSSLGCGSHNRRQCVTFPEGSERPAGTSRSTFRDVGSLRKGIGGGGGDRAQKGTGEES